MLSSLLTTIIPTFGIVGLGWLCRRLQIWGKESVRVLNNYAYYIALPALIFEAIYPQDLLTNATNADLRYLLGLVLAHLAVALLALPLLSTRTPRDIRATAPMLLTFGSTAYLGIPFATYAFGPSGTAYAAIGSVVLVVTMLFVSLGALNREARRQHQRSTWNQLLELPFLWVVLAGLLLPVVGIRTLPEFLRSTIGVIAGSAGPTALLALGAFDYDLRIQSIPWGWATVLGVGKVILPAIATFLALTALGVSGLPLAVGTALAATSIAVTAFVLADEYGVGKPLTAGAIAISTLSSLLALGAITLLWNGTRVFG